MRLYAIFAAVPLALACSTNSPSAVDVPADTLPCDVERVVSASCGQCHGATPTFGAPMALAKVSDFQALRNGVSVGELSRSRIHDTARPMPPPPNAMLSASETSVFDTWVAAGMKPGVACPTADAGTGTDAAVTDAGIGIHCTPDIELTTAAPAYEMPQTVADEYICYGVDVPLAEKRQAIAIRPRIDNANIVHHILMFQSPQAVSATPAPCSAGGDRSWKMEYAWAPGGQAIELPKEAGLPMEPVTHYVIQVHYNNARALVGQKDKSGVSLCTTTALRPNEADVLAFGNVNFALPPASTTDVTCNVKIPAAIPELHLIAAFPHMHQLGTVIATKSKGLDLGTVNNWDFNNQPWFPISGTLNAGDTVSTRCAWKNPTNQTVNYGEDTADEMCFSFTMYYPKIALPNWQWIAPAALAKCAPTP